jgi:hypothetical protein
MKTIQTIWNWIRIVSGVIAVVVAFLPYPEGVKVENPVMGNVFLFLFGALLLLAGLADHIKQKNA